MMDSTNSRYPEDDDVLFPISDLEQLAGRLIDDGTSEAEIAQPFSAKERERLVDLQWLDAMLEQAQRPANDTKTAICSVLLRLHAEVSAKAASGAESQAKSVGTAVELVGAEATAAGGMTSILERRSILWRHRRWWSSVAVMATLAAVLILWWPWQRQSADAMFERAMAAAAIDSYDRVYQVMITRRDDENAPRHAQLTVRGSKKFVFEQPGLLGGKLLIGGNGHEVWLVPQLGPVVVGDPGVVLPEWTQKSGADMPLLELSAALKRMRAHYDLTHLPAEKLTEHVGTFSHLVARRRLSDWVQFGFAPAQIDLWADPRSGVVQRVIFQWPADAKGLVPEKVELNLTDKAPSGEEVYEYSHYAGNRYIQHLRSSK